MTDEEKRAFDFCRFMRLVRVGAERGDCWEWNGTLCSGYGHFAMGTGPHGTGQPVKAHRWIYETIVGPIPEGLVVRHKCDNKCCVNPEHLLPGTYSQNAVDAVERGLTTGRKGERHPMARLKESDVLAIRAAADCGRSHGKIATEYGVSRSQVDGIVNRKSWSHI